MMEFYRIAIVGSGPSGYFSAQALQNISNETTSFKIDLFEKLPTPWGLVRSGVAPDHPKIKSVSKVFEKISDDPNFRLFANVEVGRDLSLETLKSNYDAVVLAVGAPSGKKLGIPGENLGNCWSSEEFVSWYNGHPQYSKLNVDLSGKRAIVIGAGNVAMDVARLLSVNSRSLANTDISDYALNKLKNSQITNVWLCARRGAEFASFTAPELRELPELEDTNVLISQKEINEAIDRLDADAERHVRANLEVMHSIASLGDCNKDKSLEFHFGLVPKEIRGSEKVESVLFDSAEGQIVIKADLVVTAIGYETDSDWDLRIDGNHFENTEGHIKDNLYVVGWAKRGPTGVIGTNKSDAAEVIKRLFLEITQRNPKEDQRTHELLENMSPINLSEWRQINEFEVAKGIKANRPRVKLLTMKELVKVAKGQG